MIADDFVSIAKRVDGFRRADDALLNVDDAVGDQLDEIARKVLDGFYRSGRSDDEIRGVIRTKIRELCD